MEKPASAPRPATDPAPAKWVTDRVSGFDHTVTALLPRGFPAYVRVLHPAHLRPAGPPGNGRRVEPVTWTRIAEANGRTAHRLMQWPGICGPGGLRARQPGRYDEPPVESDLPLPVAEILVAVLRRHTTTPRRCWFGMWDGFGRTPEPPHEAEFEMPARRMWLYEGEIDAGMADFGPGIWHQSPNLWWPSDRAWCVATDIDLESTYLGVSNRGAEELLAHKGIECFPAYETDLVSWLADTLNPQLHQEGRAMP
ncbi:hypothetical protein CFN78_10975 [Amycolatopsis antarctica]|uniref:Uncharacterized protein n=1 Tax=Amycolatopsis antarctica TaxID=1854586 RepID=A0A263D586_9PSEU|nr:hypothetical protein [Amycolatopsis antarctica]OZM73359.1 hypothetical protein CFN78_10975 [Amycolatopsis antarctica]